MFGPHGSITKYDDIMKAELSHKPLSSVSSYGGITVRDRRAELELRMFIAMDPPRHDEQRKAVQPIVAPGNLAKLEHLIRERAWRILDDLPRGETFNWVDKEIGRAHV